MAATTLTEIIPDTGERITTDDPGVRDWVGKRYARTDDSYLRLNMITTPTGSPTGADGTSETITSRVDRMILGRIRADADAVIVGAETVRTEGYIVPTQAGLVILTRSGDLSGHRFAPEHVDRVLVICPGTVVDRVRDRAGGFEVLGVGGDELDPAAVLAALDERGIRRIVCEGGPTVATWLLDAGLVDELCIAIAPVIEPPANPFVRVQRRPATTVAGMIVDDAGFSYLRLRVSGPDRASASTARS